MMPKRKRSKSRESRKQRQLPIQKKKEDNVYKDWPTVLEGVLGFGNLVQIAIEKEDAEGKYTFNARWVVEEYGTAISEHELMVGFDGFSFDKEDKRLFRNYRNLVRNAVSKIRKGNFGKKRSTLSTRLVAATLYFHCRRIAQFIPKDDGVLALIELIRSRLDDDGIDDKILPLLTNELNWDEVKSIWDYLVALWKSTSNELRPISFYFLVKCYVSLWPTAQREDEILKPIIREMVAAADEACADNEVLAGAVGTDTRTMEIRGQVLNVSTFEWREHNPEEYSIVMEFILYDFAGCCRPRLNDPDGETLVHPPDGYDEQRHGKLQPTFTNRDASWEILHPKFVKLNKLKKVILKQEGLDVPKSYNIVVRVLHLLLEKADRATNKHPWFIKIKDIWKKDRWNTMNIPTFNNVTRNNDFVEEEDDNEEDEQHGEEETDDDDGRINQPNVEKNVEANNNYGNEDDRQLQENSTRDNDDNEHISSPATGNNAKQRKCHSTDGNIKAKARKKKPATTKKVSTTTTTTKAAAAATESANESRSRRRSERKKVAAAKEEEEEKQMEARAKNTEAIARRETEEGESEGADNDNDNDNIDDDNGDEFDNELKGRNGDNGSGSGSVSDSGCDTNETAADSGPDARSIGLSQHSDNYDSDTDDNHGHLSNNYDDDNDDDDKDNAKYKDDDDDDNDDVDDNDDDENKDKDDDVIDPWALLDSHPMGDSSYTLKPLKKGKTYRLRVAGSSTIHHPPQQRPSATSTTQSPTINRLSQNFNKKEEQVLDEIAQNATEAMKGVFLLAKQLSATSATLIQSYGRRLCAQHRVEKLRTLTVDAAAVMMEGKEGIQVVEKEGSEIEEEKESSPPTTGSNSSTDEGTVMESPGNDGSNAVVSSSRTPVDPAATTTTMVMNNGSSEKIADPQHQYQHHHRLSSSAPSNTGKRKRKIEKDPCRTDSQSKNNELKSSSNTDTATTYNDDKENEITTNTNHTLKRKRKETHGANNMSLKAAAAATTTTTSKERGVAATSTDEDTPRKKELRIKMQLLEVRNNALEAQSKSHVKEIKQLEAALAEATSTSTEENGVGDTADPPIDRIHKHNKHQPGVRGKIAATATVPEGKGDGTQGAETASLKAGLAATAGTSMESNTGTGTTCTSTGGNKNDTAADGKGEATKEVPFNRKEFRLFMSGAFNRKAPDQTTTPRTSNCTNKHRFDP